MPAPERGLVVLDASALVELVVAGKHRAGADALLDRYRRAEGLTLVSAAHGLIEATSAIRRMTHQGALRADDGLQAVGWLGELTLTLDPTAPRLRRIWGLRERMSAYDAAYAAAAEALDTPLVTTDERLLRASRDAGIAATHLAELATRS